MKRLLCVLLLITPFIGFSQTEIIKQFHDNGNIGVEGTVINGQQEGYWKYYYKKNGQLKRAGSYKNGSLDGFWKYYNENGQLTHEGNFINDKTSGIWEFYYKNGKLRRTGEYIDGKENGFWKAYYETGELMSELNYVIYNEQTCGNPPFGTTSGTFFHGHSVSYFKNGQKKREENWKCGLEDGMFKTFNEEGQLLFIEIYEDGNFLKTIRP